MQEYYPADLELWGGGVCGEGPQGWRHGVVVVGPTALLSPIRGQPGKTQPVSLVFTFLQRVLAESYRSLILNDFPSASYQTSPQRDLGSTLQKLHTTTQYRSPLIQLFLFFFSF